MPVSWDRLSPEEFTRLCYHLLIALGFVNLKNFEGTGDRQRDIEALFVIKVLPSVILVTRWIAQCKRFLQRRPSLGDLHETIAWADVHHPDYLLFMTSQNLTADTRDALEEISRNSRFRIVCWEKDTLESLVYTYRDHLQIAGFQNLIEPEEGTQDEIGKLLETCGLESFLSARKNDFETVLYHLILSYKAINPALDSKFVMAAFRDILKDSDEVTSFMLKEAWPEDLKDAAFRRLVAEAFNCAKESLGKKIYMP